MKNFQSLILKTTAQLIIVLIVVTSSTPMQDRLTLLPADQCDWTGSEGDNGGGVQPVYLRCDQGTVLWRYPRGALRVILYGITNAKNGFRICVKISGPAQVYLEVKDNLTLIYPPKGGKHSTSHHCFHSHEHLVALYVEAEEPSPSYTKVKLQYDIMPIAELEPGELEIEAECKPCTREGLALAYCQSNLVARGTVSAVQKKLDSETAELVLHITKILHRVDENDDNDTNPINVQALDVVHIRLPAICEAKHGQGEFVIMARRRLGDLTLACAPRLEEWLQAVEELKSAPCVLKS